ncbi:MAG: YbjN domain-containing protein [Alphaproteobacteria bacterium]|nr:YbjN domain-containing protein [Alphaproteobacteria bacterium]
MQLALAANYNPIDLVEEIFNAQSYELERRGINEVAVEVQGKWNNMLLFFAWEEHIKCLHLSCLMDVENVEPNNSKVFELLALVNEDLWLGHFSFWKEQNMPIFKHSILLANNEDITSEKISQIIDIAIKECERMHPIFKAVLVKGIEPEQALYPMNMVTVGMA